MNLRHIFIFLTFSALALSGFAQERLFPYPEPPEEMNTLEERTTFLVERFWERCNVTTAIRNREAFKSAFNDYVSFMPYANAEAVHKSVDGLIARFKKEPERLLTLAEIAEETLYGPDAEIVSDEIYLPFAQAAANNKKIPADRRKYFARHAQILSQSQVGMIAPDIEFTRADGTKGRLSDLKGKHTLIFFDSPDCFDCFMARVSLSADTSVNDLLDKGAINVICLYPGKYTAEWAASTSTINPRWIVAASEAVDANFDMRNPPVMYYLNPSNKILSKTLLVDNLIEAFRSVNQRYQGTAAEQPEPASTPEAQ